MPASLDHIHAGTPMGANLVEGGATFRVWAPNARAVHVIGDFNGRRRDDSSLLNRGNAGHWLGFVPGVRDSDAVRFYPPVRAESSCTITPSIGSKGACHGARCSMRRASASPASQRKRMPAALKSRSFQ